MFQTKVNRRTLAASAAVSLAATKVAGSVSAQEATPESGSAAYGVTTEVLLTGLADPRFVVVDGSDVYFTEAGTGGDEAIYATPEAGTPVVADPINFTGRTGKVSRLSADGTVTEIASDLISYTFGASGEINGPAGLALDGAGSVYISMSTGPTMPTLPHTDEDGVLLKIDIESGERTVVADLVEWETLHNPDPMMVYSNPFGMCLFEGVAYIADAAANTIIAVDVESGEMSTFAVTGGLPVDFFPEEGNPARDGDHEIDSVPSSVTPGPDGRLYVSYITGGPFPPGGAPVDAFSPDGTKERVVEGLTMTSDIAFDSSGNMYASILSTDMINGGPGQVVRVEADGTFTVVMDGLAMTQGIAFDGDDNLYVINKSSMVPGGGELLKIVGVTRVPASNGLDVLEGETTPVTDDVEPGGANTFHVNFVDTAFEPATFTIPANTDVTLTFKNEGFLAHDFVIQDPKFVSDVLANGGTTELTVNLKPGTYTFYCSQIGHRQMGMEGTLTAQ